jgi:DNA-binding PadR family transcriptional regulator
MGERPLLDSFEELVLLAICRLDEEERYGVPIRQTVETEGGRPTSIGALYAALERLEQKGFVRSWQGEATPERGGRRKRYFAVEGAGIEALQEAERARQKLRSGIRLPGLRPAGGAA